MIVNDDVMVGNSQGSAETTNNNMLLFEGSLSLENNGGFSSVKTDGNWNLENFEGYKMRVKGDGRTYQVYTESDEWTEVFVPFNELKGSHWGRDLPERRFNKSRVYKFSLLIADKIEGPFRLEVDWIKSADN